MRKKLVARRKQFVGKYIPSSSVLPATSYQLQARSRGFTVIELLVVVAIITILGAVILANNNLFGGQTLLQNLTYDMALSMRQAQVYGISVARFGSGTSPFNYGYGMHFDVASPASYNLFADAVTVNGIYDGGEDVPPSPYSINQGFYIKKLCMPAGTDSASCTAVNKLDILYIRPEPDGCISTNGTPSAAMVSGNEQCTSLNTSARIVVSSPRGDTDSIVIYQNGQISVSGN